MVGVRWPCCPSRKIRRYDAGHRFACLLPGRAGAHVGGGRDGPWRSRRRRKHRAQSLSRSRIGNGSGHCRTALSDMASSPPRATNFELSRGSYLGGTGARPLDRSRSTVPRCSEELACSCRETRLCGDPCRSPPPAPGASWPKSARPDTRRLRTPLMMPRGHGRYSAGGSLPCSRMFPIFFSPRQRPVVYPLRPT